MSGLDGLGWPNPNDEPQYTPPGWTAIDLDALCRVIAQYFGFGRTTVHPTSRLVADLRLDTLDLIELTMLVEEEYEVEISDEQADAWRTVEDIAATLVDVRNKFLGR